MIFPIADTDSSSIHLRRDAHDPFHDGSGSSDAFDANVHNPYGRSSHCEASPSSSWLPLLSNPYIDLAGPCTGHDTQTDEDAQTLMYAFIDTSLCD
ncbi:hypothetical protein NMY22_g18535 [Coprinellus aureogranulatus]|nr:hypothetical protein NMY22_g18535 [Coprinellus aureogranulatus]